MFLAYAFLGPTNWCACRLTHLPHDQLPPLCDYDEARTPESSCLSSMSHPVTHGHSLTVCSQHLDPFSGANKGRNLFWGIVKIFLRSPILQSIILFIFVSVPVFSLPAKFDNMQCDRPLRCEDGYSSCHAQATRVRTSLSIIGP